MAKHFNPITFIDLAFVSAVLDVIQIILLLSGKNDSDVQKLAKTLSDKLEELRKNQERMVKEMRVLFAETNQLQVQLYIDNMNNDMKGFLETLQERIEEIAIFRSPQGKKETRDGLLLLRTLAQPHIKKIVATGPVAFQGLVIGFGFLRTIFDGLQRTATDRDVHKEYRLAEANSFKNYDKDIQPFLAAEGQHSVPARIDALLKDIKTKEAEIYAIEKNPTIRKVEYFTIHRSHETCTRTVDYSHTWVITGTIENGWTDTYALVTHSDTVGHCESRSIDGPIRERFLDATAAAPEPGEFDPVDVLTADNFGSPQTRLTAFSPIASQGHPHTLRLNELSAEIRALKAQSATLGGVLTALRATLDGIAKRRSELPPV